MPTRTFRYSQQDFSGGVGEHPERLADNELAAATYLDCVSERPALQLGGLVNNHALYRQLGGIQGLWFSGYYSSVRSGRPHLPTAVLTDTERGTSPPAYTTLIALSSLTDGTRVKEIMVNLPAPYMVSGLAEGQMYFPTKTGESNMLTNTLDGSENLNDGVEANVWVGKQVAISKNRGTLLFLRETSTIDGYSAFSQYNIITAARNFGLETDGTEGDESFPTLTWPNYIRNLPGRWARPYARFYAQSPDLLQRALPLFRSPVEATLTGDALPNNLALSGNIGRRSSGEIVAYDTIGDYLFFARRYGGSVQGVAPYREFPYPTGNARPFITANRLRIYDPSKLLRLDLPDGEQITHMYALGTHLHIYTRQGDQHHRRIQRILAVQHHNRRQKLWFRDGRNGGR